MTADPACLIRLVLVTLFISISVIKWAFGRLRRKTASRGREDTRVWYRETMFSQMVSYDFLLHEPLHGYFLYLVCAPPEKPTKRCEPEEGYLLNLFLYPSFSLFSFSLTASSSVFTIFFFLLFFDALFLRIIVTLRLPLR